MYDTADKHGSTKGNKVGDKRFAAVDPVKGDVRNPQSLVQYTYVLNNPIFYIDPLGMMAVDKLNLLTDIYVNTNGLTESQLYLTCLVLNGKNAGTAHHEFVSIMTAKELKQKGINYELEHAVQNKGQWMEIDVLASNKEKTSYWIYEVKPKGQQYKVRTEEQIERYNKALTCETGKEKVRYSNFPKIFFPAAETITLFNNMPNAFSQQAIKMEISHNGVGLITYRMWSQNGTNVYDLNTKTAAAKATEETEYGRAIDSVSGVLGQYTLGELKEEFEQGKTLTGLRNSLAVNAIAQNTTCFVFAGKVYKVGGAIAQGVLEGSMAKSWVVNTLGI